MMPTEQEITEARTEAEVYWSRAHDEMNEDDTYFRNDISVPSTLPKAARWVKSPKGNEIIQRAVRQIDIGALKVEGVPKGDSEAARKLANDRENWLYGAITADRRRAHAEMRAPPYQAAIFSLMLRGMAYLKTVEDVDAYEPVKKKGEDKLSFEERHRLWEIAQPFPYPTVAVDPLTVSMLPGGEMLFEKRTCYLSELKREAEHQGWELRLSGYNRQVIREEVWTKDEVVYLVDQKVVKRVKHGYRFIPYTWQFSGLGSGFTITANAIDDGPQHLAVGLLRYEREPILQLALKESFLEYQERMLSFPQMAVVKGTDEPESPVGTWYYERGDAAPHWIMPPDKMGEMLALIAAKEDGIDQRTTPRILGGMTPRRQQTATEIMGAISQARLVIQGPITAMETLVENSLEHKQRLLEMASGKAKRVKGEVSVSAWQVKRTGVERGRAAQLVTTSLSGSKLDGWYKVKATIQPTSPQEQALKVQIETEKMKMGLQDRRTTQINIGIEDPEGTDQQIFNERTLAGLIAQASQMAAQELGMEWQAEKEGVTVEELKERLAGTPSGMPVPQQMEARVPGSPAEAAQLLGQTQQMGGI